MTKTDRLTAAIDSVYWVKETDEWHRRSDDKVICPDHASPVIPCPYCLRLCGIDD